MTYTVERPRRISKRAVKLQDAFFWRSTWPTLKANGWTHDSKYGGFYPPEAQKQHAANRRRLGSDHKNFFKDIHELTSYLSSNPFLYVDGEERKTDETNIGARDTGKTRKSIMLAAKKGTRNAESEYVGHKTSVSRSPSSVAVESTTEFIKQHKVRNMNLKNNVPFHEGPSELQLPTTYDASASNAVVNNDLACKETKKIKSLKFRGPNKPKAARSVGYAVEQSCKKVTSKKKRKKRGKKGMVYDSNGNRIYICDRCGRNDFTNGHALGGHKKYCQKPEYDEAREKNARAKSRKRSRSGDNSSKFVAKRKSIMNLNDITDSIRKFAENIDQNVFVNPFIDDTNSSDKFALYEDDENLNILDEVVNAKDLFELEVIQHVLREEKARLAGRLAGLKAEKEKSLNFQDHFVGKHCGALVENVDNDADKICSLNARQETDLWQNAGNPMPLKRIKSFELGEAVTSGRKEINPDDGADHKRTILSDVVNSENAKFKNAIHNIHPIPFEGEEKFDRDEDDFFSCNDVLSKSDINMNPSRQPSFTFGTATMDAGDEEKLEFELGEDLAMELGF